MSRQLLARARAEGLLPETADWPADEPGSARPWPVVMLMTLGAWLVALPLLGLVGLLLSELLEEGPGLYVAGAVLLAAAVLALRLPKLPLFIEQLALPALLAGGTALGFSLFRDLGLQPAAALLLALSLALALILERPWLRSLLGAAAAVFAALAIVPLDINELRHGWRILAALLLAWALALGLQRSALMAGHHARWALYLDDLTTGWLGVCLFGLFTLGQGGFDGQITLRQEESVGSLVFALAGAAVALRAWPALRRPPLVAGLLVLAGLAWPMPAFGPLLFALAVCACSGRGRQAAAAALVALFVLGLFYYQLAWPLADKALLLAAAGAALALLGWLAGPGAGGGKALAGLAGGSAAGKRVAALLLGGLALTLVLVNVAIRQKEALIAEGRPVFVPLVPVDPRSLMQGDYMRLRFALPDALQEMPELGRLAAGRPQVVARIDARGVAEVLDLYAGKPLGADELLIELTPKDGSWVIVTDAWFFREGDGPRFEAAKFGEFRVLPDGRALLVGMAGADLKPIK